MPIQTLRDSIYKINDFVFQRDARGYYLSMNLGHCDAAVLCISQRSLISAAELDLTERELGFLLRGSKIDKKDYILQGITRQALAGNNRYRSFEVSPPAHVQIWGMKENDLEINLFIPDDTSMQSATVPQLFSVQMDGNQMYIGIDNVDGYHDGDLVYQIGDHLPIPIPRSWLNCPIPLPVSFAPNVMAAEHVHSNYTKI